MILKYFFSGCVLALTSFSALSQVIKVTRKGVSPTDVTKNTQPTSTYSLPQLSGKWQEVSRSTKKNSSVDFKDTLFYNFSGHNVSSRDGVNMSLKGEAFIDAGNVLVAAADVFTIRSLSANRLVLDDGDYIHTLVKKNVFWLETLPSNAIAPEKFNTPVPVNASALSGKWKVYRRAAKPGATDKVLIRILNVIDIKSSSTATGEITFYKTEKLETLPCTIILDGEKMQISTEKNTWNVMVYKADGKDFVFGDPTLMYYCKPL